MEEPNVPAETDAARAIVADYERYVRLIKALMEMPRHTASEGTVFIQDVILLLAVEFKIGMD